MPNEDQDVGSAPPAELQLPCAKCGQINPRTAEHCSRCGKHLYLACKRCGHRNVRLVRRCTRCGRRLHRPAWHALTRRSIRGLSVIEIAILVVLVVAIVKVVQNMFDFSGTPPETPPPEISY